MKAENDCQTFDIKDMTSEILPYLSEKPNDQETITRMLKKG